MTEFAVQLVLKQVEISASTADEAVVKAVNQAKADLHAQVTGVTVTKLDRIQVTGFNGRP